MHAQLDRFAAVIAFVAIACVPVPPPRPLPTGEGWEDACANMARLGDSVGNEPDCAEQLAKVHALGIVSMEPECVIAAETREQLDACDTDDIE